MSNHTHYVYTHYNQEEADTPIYVGMGTTSCWSSTPRKRHERAYSKQSRCKGWYQATDNGETFWVDIVLETDNYAEAKQKEKELINMHYDNLVNTHKESSGKLGINMSPVYALKAGTREIVHSYNSIAEASRHNELHSSNISMCCQGKQDRAGEYAWCYQADYDRYTPPTKLNRLGSQKIVQLSLTGKYIATFDNISRCSEALDIPKATISLNINKTYDHAGGYLFFDYDDYINGNYELPDLTKIKINKVEKVRKDTNEVVEQYERKKHAPLNQHQMNKALKLGYKYPGEYYYRTWIKES